MIVAVHAEWFDDLNAGAYTVALDGGKGEAFVVEDWVNGDQQTWVYATLQGLLAAEELRPSVPHAERLVIGDRADLAQLVRRAWPGRLGDACRMRDERFPGVRYRCKAFINRPILRSVLRDLVLSSTLTETSPTEASP
jgi:hypothetical protein